jgi:hypothetical protein
MKHPKYNWYPVAQLQLKRRSLGWYGGDLLEISKISCNLVVFHNGYEYNENSDVLRRTCAEHANCAQVVTWASDRWAILHNECSILIYPEH